tara:strand:+ start:158 stop:274 length:117 start_codon:yes stop_codon:yes gene_type:complete
MDEVVLAGILVVVGTIVFFGGFGYFIYQDNKKTKEKVG